MMGSKCQIEGQMNIFEFLQCDDGQDDFEKITIKKAAEIIGSRLGLKFFLDERHFKDHYSASSKGFYIQIGFNVDYEGKRYLDTEVDYKKGGFGTPATSIDDCINSIKRYMERCTKQEKKKIPVDIRGICCDGWCPVCNTWLDDLAPECPECHSMIDWSRWIRMNEKESDNKCINH